MAKNKKLTEEEKKIMYWCLKMELDHLDAGCSDCHDIDCSGNYTYKLLKDKHKVDVIDKKACKKQMKKEAERLRKIVYHPFFKKQRLDPCHHCKKEFERDDMEWCTVHKDYRGTVRVDYFCRECIKKFKLKDYLGFKIKSKKKK